MLEPKLEIHGDLDSGLTIIATLPRHIAGVCHPVMQTMLLTVADSRALASKLAKKHAAFLVAHDLEKITVEE